MCDPELIKWMDEWENTTYICHITIQDILNMKIGEYREFICLDRNWSDFYENIEDWDRTNKWPLNIWKKWKGYRLGYLKTHEGISGKIQIMNSGKSFDEKLADSEFHIEYSKGCWYPLEEKNGTSLPEICEFGVIFKRRHYTEYPKYTRLGWRGPIVELKRLKCLKEIL